MAHHGIAMPANPARWEDLKAMGFEPPAGRARCDEHHNRAPCIPDKVKRDPIWLVPGENNLQWEA